jgi:hypothetical protein
MIDRFLFLCCVRWFHLFTSFPISEAVFIGSRMSVSRLASFHLVWLVVGGSPLREKLVTVIQPRVLSASRSVCLPISSCISCFLPQLCTCLILFSYTVSGHCLLWSVCVLCCFLSFLRRFSVVAPLFLCRLGLNRLLVVSVLFVRRFFVARVSCRFWISFLANGV